MWEKLLKDGDEEVAAMTQKFEDIDKVVENILATEGSDVNMSELEVSDDDEKEPASASDPAAKRPNLEWV